MVPNWAERYTPYQRSSILCPAEEIEHSAPGMARATTARSLGRLPAISRFRGVAIVMYYADHNPPHFHARSADQEMKVSLDPVQMSEGRLPAAVQGIVLEWAATHQQELLQNWERMRRGERLQDIDPWPDTKAKP